MSCEIAPTRANNDKNEGNARYKGVVPVNVIAEMNKEKESAVIKACNCMDNVFNPIDFKTDELKAILLTKNNDYGKSFDKLRTEYGMTATLIRLEDKLNRIKVLTKDAAQVKDESISDTLMDLAGYCILELVYRMEKKNDQ